SAQHAQMAGRDGQVVYPDCVEHQPHNREHAVGEAEDGGVRDLPYRHVIDQPRDYRRDRKPDGGGDGGAYSKAPQQYEHDDQRQCGYGRAPAEGMSDGRVIGLKHLQHRSWVEDVLRIEGLLDTAGQLDHVGAHLVWQPGFLEPAHSVLAGDGPAQLDCQVHDFTERDLCAFRLVGIVGVVDDQRMGVAVAGVRDDRTDDVLLGGDGLDTFDERGQRRQRDPDVFEQQVTQAFDGGDGESPCRGEPFTFVGVVGGEHVGRVAELENVRHEGCFSLAITGRVRLRDQHRA